MQLTIKPYLLCEKCPLFIFKSFPIHFWHTFPNLFQINKFAILGKKENFIVTFKWKILQLDPLGTWKNASPRWESNPHTLRQLFKCYQLLQYGHFNIMSSKFPPLSPFYSCTVICYWTIYEFYLLKNFKRPIKTPTKSNKF